MVGVRKGDKALILHACNMWLFTDRRGMFVTTPDAYFFAVEVSVVSPGAA
jgi:hypothetical protein